MPDKQPSFTVTFKELAVAAIKRQTRGHVIMVLNSELDQKSYTSLNETDSSNFSPDDYLTLELCFMGNPKKVTVLKKEEEISSLTQKLDKYTNYTLIYDNVVINYVIDIELNYVIFLLVSL